MKNLAMLLLFPSCFIQAAQRTPSPALASVELHLVQASKDRLQKFLNDKLNFIQASKDRLQKFLNEKLYQAAFWPVFLIGIMLTAHAIILYEMADSTCKILNDGEKIRFNLDKATEKIACLQTELQDKDRVIADQKLQLAQEVDILGIAMEKLKLQFGISSEE